MISGFGAAGAAAGVETVSRRGGAAVRSTFAAAAAAAAGLGRGASFKAAEKVLYSSAVMVRKKFSCFGGAAFDGGAAGAAADAGTGWDLNCTAGRSGVWFSAPSTP